MARRRDLKFRAVRARADHHCRSQRAGEVACYPLVQNHHEAGILRKTLAPAPGVSEELQRAASQHIEKLLAHLDYVGVLALELFQVGDTLIANEIAPRVHNTGHWTIEGARTTILEHLPPSWAAARGHRRVSPCAC